MRLGAPFVGEENRALRYGPTSRSVLATRCISRASAHFGADAALLARAIVRPSSSSMCSAASCSSCGSSRLSLRQGGQQNRRRWRLRRALRPAVAVAPWRWQSRWSRCWRCIAGSMLAPAAVSADRATSIRSTAAKDGPSRPGKRRATSVSRLKRISALSPALSPRKWESISRWKPGGIMPFFLSSSNVSSGSCVR